MNRPSNQAGTIKSGDGEHKIAVPRPDPHSVSARSTPVVEPPVSEGMHDRPTPMSTVIPRLPAALQVFPVRSRMQTLIFHGAPPAPPAPESLTPKPPPLPKAPTTRPEGFDDHVAFELVSLRDASASDVRSSEILLEDRDSRESIGDFGPPEEQSAKYESPFIGRSERASALPRKRMRLARASIAAAALVAIPWHLGLARAARDRLLNPALLMRSPSPSHAPAPAIAPPPMPSGSCRVAGAPRLLARRAFVKGGVEAMALDDRLAFGVVTGNKQGAAFELDATSLVVTSTARVISPDPVKRVVPELFGDAPLDAEVDPNAMRIAPDPDGDAVLGLRAGTIVWGSRDNDAVKKLWKLEGAKGASGELDSPRVVALGASGDRALVLRHAGAIWIGAFRASEASPPLGPMVRLSDGMFAGTPAVDARGDEVIVAWAQRETKTSAWGIRWTRWHAGSDVDKPRALVLPPGGPGERAIAPSVSVLDGGRFLLAWTEGATARHQVRAMVIDASDQRAGEPLAISQPDAVAGQEQIALARDGRGAIAYLVSKGSAFELVAAPIECSVTPASGN